MFAGHFHTLFSSVFALMATVAGSLSLCHRSLCKVSKDRHMFLHAPVRSSTFPDPETFERSEKAVHHCTGNVLSHPYFKKL